jgi:hypothetical protein
MIAGALLGGAGCHRQSTSSPDTIEVGGIRWRVTTLKEVRRYLRAPGTTVKLVWQLMTSTNHAGPDLTHWVRVEYRFLEPTSGLPENARRNIAATLRRAFPGSLSVPDTNAPVARLLAARRDHFCAEYEDFIREFDPSALTYQEQWRLTALPPVGRTVTVQLDCWDDTGGAHGNSSREYFVFERDTGRRLSLDDLLSARARPRLTALLKTALRRARKLPAEQSLEQAGFWEKDIRPRAAQWTPAPGGLRFHFDAYAIGPYALGPGDGVIPWPEAASCLTPHARRLLTPPAPPAP